jgi:hypothetical protein
VKINKIITATDANLTYISFGSLMSKAWMKLTGIKPTVAYIKSNTDIDYLAIEYLKIHTDVHVFEKLPIDIGIQSKITRMFLASELIETNNMIVDIDMIPLDPRVLTVYEQVPNDHLAQFGGDHPSFQRHPDIGKWPMHGTTAHGSVFRDMINPQGLDYQDLLASWTGFPEDPRSNVLNPYHGFSDESLLKCIFEQWPKKEDKHTKINRTNVGDGFDPEPVYGRLCRSKHFDISHIDLSKHYEAHGPRPYSDNLQWYQPIEEFINNI